MELHDFIQKVALTLTMERQIMVALDVINIMLNGVVNLTTMTLIPKSCVVSVEEVETVKRIF